MPSTGLTILCLLRRRGKAHDEARAFNQALYDTTDLDGSSTTPGSATRTAWRFETVR
ncbi:hypothetical protein SPHINGOT1_340008 [Sphingomonas sp. T1]|nr:hypothetical protein SPHINGOT1_340008 [Sphingomonas sp. T1]